MTVIGLTGGFGTGKSTVAAMFRALGAKVLDADRIAHKALDKGCPVRARVIKMFGRGILKKDGSIDRARLGGIVFKDKRLLAGLCGVVHPFVINYMKKEASRIKRRDPSAIVILDVPLLFEANLLRMVDQVIVVKADRPAQIARCRRKTGLTERQVGARIKLQAPITRKIRLADFVINNNGARERTKREVKRVWEKLKQRTITR